MSKRSDELSVLRALAVAAESLIGGTGDMETLRQSVSLWVTFRPRKWVGRQQGEQLGGGGVVSNPTSSITGSSLNGEILTENQNPQSVHFQSAHFGRPTWLSAFGSAWVERLGKGSQPAWGQMARALKPLVAEHGEAEVLRRWVLYLRGTGAQYVSVSRFGATFGAWVTGDPDAWKHDRMEFRPGESHEAYIRRTSEGR